MNELFGNLPEKPYLCGIDFFNSNLKDKPVMPISVVIQTYNAQKYLQQVLNSVKGFDEVVLCDMESTDDTVSIAESAGCKVVTFPKGNYNICEPARDFAIHSATHEWVLVVDADEFVTPELKDYLYKYIEKPEHDALYIHRKNMFLGKWIKASYPDSQLRFMRQKKATWPPTIHSVPTIDGTIGQMPKDPKYALVHAGVTVKGQIQKMNDYTENDLVKRGQANASLMQMIFSPLWRFLKYYFFEGACLEGRAGFIKAAFSASGKFYYLAKVYERHVYSGAGGPSDPSLAPDATNDVGEE